MKSSLSRHFNDHTKNVVIILTCMAIFLWKAMMKDFTSRHSLCPTPWIVKEDIISKFPKFCCEIFVIIFLRGEKLLCGDLKFCWGSNQISWSCFIFCCFFKTICCNETHYATWEQPLVKIIKIFQDVSKSFIKEPFIYGIFEAIIFIKTELPQKRISTVGPQIILPTLSYTCVLLSVFFYIHRLFLHSANHSFSSI